MFRRPAVRYGKAQPSVASAEVPRWGVQREAFKRWSGHSLAQKFRHTATTPPRSLLVLTVQTVVNTPACSDHLSLSA